MGSDHDQMGTNGVETDIKTIKVQIERGCHRRLIKLKLKRRMRHFSADMLQTTKKANLRPETKPCN